MSLAIQGLPRTATSDQISNGAGQTQKNKDSDKNVLQSATQNQQITRNFLSAQEHALAAKNSFERVNQSAITLKERQIIPQLQTLPSTFQIKKENLPANFLAQHTNSKQEAEREIKQNPTNLGAKTNLARHSLFLGDLKTAEEQVKETKQLNYWYDVVHFCDYSIQLYKGIGYDVQSIKNAVLALRRCLAINPNFDAAKKALSNVQTNAQIKWILTTKENLENYLQSLEEAFVVDPFKDEENLPFDSRKLSPEFLEAYPFYKTKEAYQAQYPGKLDKFSRKADMDTKNQAIAIKNNVSGNYNIYLQPHQLVEFQTGSNPILDEEGNPIPLSKCELILVTESQYNDLCKAIQEAITMRNTQKK